MLASIEASLVAGGFKATRDSVAGRQAVVARSTRLRFGPRRHVFVLVAVFKAGMAGREHLDRFQDEAGQYAATVKAGPASGATAVAIAVVEAGGGDDPGDWPVTVPGRPPSGRAATFPALVDISAAQVTCPATPIDLRRLVQEHAGAASMRMV